MKKQTLCIFLASLMIFSLTACGDSTSSTATNTSTMESIQENTEPEIQTSAENKDSEASNIATNPAKETGYTVTLHSQERSYLFSDTLLANVVAQRVALSGKDSPAMQDINNRFSESNDYIWDLVEGRELAEEDSLSNFAYNAYELYQSIAEWGNTDSFMENSFSNEYIVHRVDDMVFSVEQVCYYFTGGAHGSAVVTGANYNMQTGEPLLLSDLTDDYDSFYAYLREQLLSLADELQAEQGVFFNSYREDIDLIIQDDTYYFGEEGLYFISSPYTLQPYAAGLINLCIPYEHLEGYVKSELLPTEQSWNFETATATEEPLVQEFVPDFEQCVLPDIINSFLSWTGMQYMYYEDRYFETLTPEAALSMAGFAIIENSTYDESWYDENNFGYAIPADFIDAYTQNYFGTTYDITAFESSELYPMVAPTENGELLVQVGDWGLAIPTFAISSAIQDTDGSYTVTVDYYCYDYETNEESEVLATAAYMFVPDDNSTFGYIISDMQFATIY